MTPEKLKKERKKVALELETYEKLKNFTRFNGLKLRSTIDTLVDLMLQDDALREKVVDITRNKD